MNAGEEVDALAVLDWLPGLPDEPATPREDVAVGFLPGVVPPLAPTPIASTPVAPEPVLDEPEEESVFAPEVPLGPAEFEPVTVASVLAPVIELPTLDPEVVELSVSEEPEVDPAGLEPPLVEPLEPPLVEPPEPPLVEPLEPPVWVLEAAVVWVLPVVAVAVGVGEVAVESLGEAVDVLVVVLTAVVLVAVDCAVLLEAVVVTSAQKFSHWEKEGNSVCEYTSEGVDAKRLMHDSQFAKSVEKAESLWHSAGTLPID